MNKTIILDIDGVLNPFYARQQKRSGHLEGFSEFEVEVGYNVFLSHDHWNWIKKFLSMNVSLVWGSAWGKESNSLLPLWNIEPDWEYIPIDNENVGLGTWKLKSIKRWVEKNSVDNFVWIDDELEDDAFQWTSTIENSWAIAPNRVNGLCENDFEKIHEWLKN